MITNTIKKYRLQPKRLITTVINEDSFIWCKENNISWASVVSRGVVAIRGDPQVQERIAILEEENRLMLKNVSRMQAKILEMNSKIEDTSPQ
jgi:hypothetical protein